MRGATADCLRSSCSRDDAPTRREDHAGQVVVCIGKVGGLGRGVLHAAAREVPLACRRRPAGVPRPSARRARRPRVRAPTTGVSLTPSLCRGRPLDARAFGSARILVRSGRQRHAAACVGRLPMWITVPICVPTAPASALAATTCGSPSWLEGTGNDRPEDPGER